MVIQVPSSQGSEMLNIFKNYSLKTSILDDFQFYETRQKFMQDNRARKQTHLQHQPVLFFAYSLAYKLWLLVSLCTSTAGHSSSQQRASRPEASPRCCLCKHITRPKFESVCWKFWSRQNSNEARCSGEFWERSCDSRSASWCNSCTSTKPRIFTAR